MINVWQLICMPVHRVLKKKIVDIIYGAYTTRIDLMIYYFTFADYIRSIVYLDDRSRLNKSG